MAQVESTEVSDHVVEVDGMTFLIDDWLKRYLDTIRIDYAASDDRFIIRGE